MLLSNFREGSKGRKTYVHFQMNTFKLLEMKSCNFYTKTLCTMSTRSGYTLSYLPKIIQLSWNSLMNVTFCDFSMLIFYIAVPTVKIDLQYLYLKSTIKQKMWI